MCFGKLLFVFCWISLLSRLSSYLNEYWNNDENLFSDFEHELDRRKLWSKNDEDVKLLENLHPVKDNYDTIMFWRPQKVGSSTLLSILMSYAYRYQLTNKRKASPNSFCRLIGQCTLETDRSLSKSVRKRLKLYIDQKIPGNSNTDVKATDEVRSLEKVSLAIPFKMVLTHELCALETKYIQKYLPCAFGKGKHPPKKDHPVKQLFLVREPLSRAISIYYFWGELSKMVIANSKGISPRFKNGKKRKNKDQRILRSNAKRARAKLGSTNSTGSVERGMFRYHGVESTPPPLEYGLDFANKFPYRVGMPGPSFTWSAFAVTVEDAIDHILSDNMLTLVLDHLDESLIVAVHYLNWSIADVVVTMQRKSLSSHPKYTAWPNASIAILQKKLQANGEFQTYYAAVRQLNRKIEALKNRGVDFDGELNTLRTLRRRVSQICLNITYLDYYRKDLQLRKLPLHESQNKLRDVEDIYLDRGHLFSLNREILGSFDVCGNCEAHALMLGVEIGLSQTIENSTTLSQLDISQRQRARARFSNCPRF